MDIPAREDMNERQERLLDANIFLARFLVAGAVFHLVLSFRPDTYILQSWLAEATAGSLTAAGVAAHSSGISVFSMGGEFLVTQDCLGWKSAAAFLGLGYASGRSNILYAAAGVAVLLLLNLVRVFTTVLLSRYFSFELLHSLMWRWGLTLLVLVCWLVWTGLERAEGPKTPKFEFSRIPGTFK